jgi:hypothetical protein
VVLGVFSAGLLLGALLSATVLWLLSGLLTPVPAGWRQGLLVLAAVAAVARDAGWLRLPLPQNARQIPQQVLQRHLVRGTLQFGFELGTGVRTYVSSSAPYVLVLAVLLTGGPATALAIGCGFAAGRALTPALRLASGAPAAWDERLTARLRPLTCLACVGIALAVTLRAVLGP